MPRGGKRQGAGRPQGIHAKPRLTVELKATLAETAKRYTVDALQTIVTVMKDGRQTGTARTNAANILLDRGWGKAPQTLEHTGKNGEPIKIETLSELELARRIAFALELGARAKAAPAEEKKTETS